MNYSNFQAPQLSRMILILDWLRNGKSFNSEDVVDFYQDEISVRTIKNDIENLRVLGFDVEYNYHKKSYALMGESGELPLPQIRDSEIAMLQLAQQMFESIGVQPLADTTDEFVNRVRELMPQLTGRDVSCISPSLTVLHGSRAETSFPHFEELNSAIRESRSARIKYFTMYRNEYSERVIDPYHLVSKDGRSYVIAWCHNREAVLIFRLDRVRELELLESFFEVRDDFNQEEFLAPMFGIFNDGEPFNVKVRFSTWLARWIREDQWHPSQVFTDLPDGSLQVDLEVTGTIDVKRWILSFGRDAEVLEPEHLRSAVAFDAKHMAAMYSS